MPLVPQQRVFSRLRTRWQHGTMAAGGDPAQVGPLWRRVGLSFPLIACVALLGAFWGSVVAVAGLNALYLCISMLGCTFILLDFRIGVVILILLMPISNSYLFPHAMLGITGLNPLNLLLIATLGSYLLHGMSNGSLRRFMPQTLFWLYIVPILISGALGSRHIGEIAPGFFIYDMLEFDNAAGYVRDLVVKPLLMVLFALLVGAAVSESRKPRWFLVPTFISIWVMGMIVIVFVLQSGVALNQLASSGSREFLSVLGLHANDLGRLYATAYALLLFVCAELKEPRLRLVLVASMGLVMVALLLTFSRGAFFGFIVVNALFLFWRRSAKTSMILGLLVVAAVLALPGAVYDRVTSGYGDGLNAISAGRVDGLWLPLLPEVLRSPVYGSGIGSILWSDAMRAEGGANVLQVTHPHNAYLQALLDMGIAGLFLLCAYFVHVWRSFRALSIDAAMDPAMRGFFQGAMAGLLSMLISNVTDSSLTPKPEQAFLWLAIGVMYGQRAMVRAS